MISAQVGCIKVKDGESEPSGDLIAVEGPLVIFLNGKHAIDVTMSPTEVKDFVIGHLICSGSINDPGDVQSFRCGKGWAEAVYEESRRSPLMSETMLSAGFGVSKKQELRLEKIQSDLKVRREEIHLALAIVLNSEAHRLTGGVHTCGVFQLSVRQREKPLLPVSLCDDIGRHNVLDKAVGKAAIEGCDFSRCFIVTTGRASSDTVTKCHGAQIPVLVSRGATTTLACELAQLAGITLIGFAAKNRMNIYCNEWRVL